MLAAWTSSSVISLSCREWQAKIADLGLGRFLAEDTSLSTNSKLGTFSYASPEQRDLGGTCVGKPSDVYSFGVSIIVMSQTLAHVPPRSHVEPVPADDWHALCLLSYLCCHALCRGHEPRVMAEVMRTRVAEHVQP